MLAYSELEKKMFDRHSWKLVHGTNMGWNDDDDECTPKNVKNGSDLECSV